jgi:hypothetical protein
MRITSLEGQEAIFLALTEFRRVLGTENAQPVSAILKAHGITHNYVPYVKKELLLRKLVNAKFTKWNDNMSVPTMLMAESIATAASKALSAYQNGRKKARQEQQRPSFADVEISPNPLRMEDEVLDGFQDPTPEPESKPISIEEAKNLFIDACRRAGLGGTSITILI